VSVQDSNQITNVNVLGVSNFIWAGESNSTTIKITFDSYPGATVNVNIYTGNNAIINGEQLQYKRINLDFNSVSYGLLSGLTRARNTTLSANIKLYDEVRSILTKNELPTGFLDKSWYSNIIETTIEDSVKYSTGSAKVIANASSGVQGDSSVSIVNSTRSGSNVFTGADTGIFYFATNTVPNIINVSAGDVISFKNGAKPIYTSLSNIAPVSPVSASGIFNFTIADHPQIQDVKVGAPLTVSNNSSILSYKKIVGTSTTTMTEFPVTYSHKNIANSAQWTIKIAEPIEIVGTNITANVGVYDNFKVISSARRTVYDSHDESNASEFVPQWEVKISNIGYNKDSNSYSQSANAQPISANSYPEVTANCKVTLSHTIMDLPLSLDGNMDSTNFSLAASFFSSTKS
jgi:hypothetical protein